MLVSLNLFGGPSPKPTGSVSLSWDRVTDSTVSEIRVYYGVHSHQYEGYLQLRPTDTACSLSGIELGEEYFFTAVAVTPDGTESAPCDEVTVTLLSSFKHRPQAILNFHSEEQSN